MSNTESPIKFPSRQVRRHFERRMAAEKESRQKAADRRESGRELAKRQLDTPQTIRVVATNAVSRLSASRFG